MIQKELSIYIFIFLFLSLGMHFSAWVDHPLVHLESLASSSLGVWHPLFITFIVYIIVLVVRVLIHSVKRVKR
jgi:hypothetical protein